MLKTKIAAFITVLLMSTNAFSAKGSGQGIGDEFKYKFNIKDPNAPAHFVAGGLFSLGGSLALKTAHSNYKGQFIYAEKDVIAPALILAALLFVKAGVVSYQPFLNQFKEVDIAKVHKSLKFNIKAAKRLKIIPRDKVFSLLVKRIEAPSENDIEKVEYLDQVTKKIKIIAKIKVKEIGKLNPLNNTAQVSELNEYLQSDELFFKLKDSLAGFDSKFNLDFAYTYYMYEYYSSYHKEFVIKKGNLK